MTLLQIYPFECVTLWSRGTWLYSARECRVDAVDFQYSHSESFIKVEDSRSHHGLESVILDVHFFILSGLAGLSNCHDATSSRKLEIIFIFVQLLAF